MRVSQRVSALTNLDDLVQVTKLETQLEKRLADTEEKKAELSVAAQVQVQLEAVVDSVRAKLDIAENKLGETELVNKLQCVEHQNALREQCDKHEDVLREQCIEHKDLLREQCDKHEDALRELQQKEEAVTQLESELKRVENDSNVHQQSLEQSQAVVAQLQVKFEHI